MIDDFKYLNGKVYKIVANGSELEYYGSTVCSLKVRWGKHLANYKLWLKGKKVKRFAVYDLFEEYGTDACEIVLVEEFPCLERHFLLAREQMHIRLNGTKSINKISAYGLNEQKAKETRNRYLQKNKKTINAKNLARYHRRKHDDDFMEERRAKYKQWREKNEGYDKARKQGWGQQIYHCGTCDVDVKRYSKTKHEQTEKH